MHQVKKRYDWIDIAKGIGVILVVLGHESLPYSLNSWIYSFHMPLFFMLSGYTFKQKGNFHDDYYLPFKRLIIPYLAYSCVFFTIDLLLFGINSPVIQKDISSIQSGQGSFGVLWFLLSIFLVRIIYTAIGSHFNGFAKACIVFLLVLTGYLLNYYFGIYAFTLITSLVSLGFFYLGNIFKTHGLSFIILPHKKNILYSIAFLLISILSCCLNHLIYHQRIELSGAVFNSLPITYLGALSGSLLIVIISCYIERFNIPGKNILKHIGLYSLWYFPLTAYIPNRFSKVVEGTDFDRSMLKAVIRIFAFGITFFIIHISGKLNSILMNRKMK